MRVQIDSRYPLTISVNAEDFGKHFAAMNSIEQTSVLRSIVEEMNAHPVQWDYISIELEGPDNQELCRKLKWVFHTLFSEMPPPPATIRESAEQHPMAVKVKSLEWVDGDEPGECKSGPYDVWREFDKHQVYYWSIVMGEPHATPEAAKAAAQADYEARILAALDVSPTTIQDAQALPEIAALADEASYWVNNPSAWDTFDQGASEIIRKLVDKMRQIGGSQ